MDNRREEDCLCLKPNYKVLESTIKYFNGRVVLVEDVPVEDNREVGWNKDLQQAFKGGINGHYFDLYKQANENYNTLRNSIFLDILEKYKNNNEGDFLTYDYLFKSIYDSYKLLSEHDSGLYSTTGGSRDDKIKIHNMVMKLICGSRQIEDSSTVIFPLSDNLNNLMSYFKASGCFNEDLQFVRPKIEYERREKVQIEIENIQIDIEKIQIENSSISNVVEEEIKVFEEDAVQRICRISKDTRYLLFLKRTSPSFYKLCEDSEDFIARQEDILKEKGKINESRSTKSKVETIRDLEKIPSIPPISDVNWTQKELQTFNYAIIKHKNNFNAVQKELPHFSRQEIIKKYYLSKNKTYSYIKKRSGRISDSEVKIIVENEWTEKEIEIFSRKFKSLGKNLTKYQTWINKTEKDLKIFLRYFLKLQKSKKKDPPQRLSISKEEILRSWSIDERQIFAIYFPYFNMNWITMATYFPQKTSGDLKLYYSKYFKGLSYNEQKFEASISNVNVLFNTFPVIHVGDKEEDCLLLESIGIIYKK